MFEGKGFATKAVASISVAVVFSLIWLVAPCFSEPRVVGSIEKRVLLAEEKGFLERTKDAVKNKAQEIALERAKKTAKKKVEDAAKAAKKKLDDARK